MNVMFTNFETHTDTTITMCLPQTMETTYNMKHVIVILKKRIIFFQ